MSRSGVWHCLYRRPPKNRILSNCMIWWGTTKIWPHRKNCVIHTILPIRPESFLSATILCSLKPETPNNIVSLSICHKLKSLTNKFFQSLSLSWGFSSSCQAPLKPSNLDVYYNFFENLAGIGKIVSLSKKSDLKTNSVMLVNIEPSFGFILEIKSIPNCLHEHMISAMHFNMGHQLE